MTTFTQLNAKLKNFLRGWTLDQTNKPWFKWKTLLIFWESLLSKTFSQWMLKIPENHLFVALTNTVDRYGFQSFKANIRQLDLWCSRKRADWRILLRCKLQQKCQWHALWLSPSSFYFSWEEDGSLHLVLCTQYIYIWTVRQWGRPKLIKIRLKCLRP